MYQSTTEETERLARFLFVWRLRQLQIIWGLAKLGFYLYYVDASERYRRTWTPG